MNTRGGQLLIALILVAALLVCLVSLVHLSLNSPLGEGDFIGYWSAARLLSLGQNAYDPQALGELQRPLVNLDFTVMAWNPPPLLVLLLPLAGLHFTMAKTVWLILNLAQLLLALLLLSKLYLADTSAGWRLGFVLLAGLFPQALLAIAMGQVSFLPLLGICASLYLLRQGRWFGGGANLYLLRQGRWFWGGASLVLTLVKPHMAVLPAAYLLAYATRRKQWALWLGLLSAVVVCGLALFWLRPNWPQDYYALRAIAPVAWATPTLGGVLSWLGLPNLFRYLVFAFLPLAWYLAQPEREDGLRSVALCTLLTVPLTFYGWSYDQSMLLIPLSAIFGSLPNASKRIQSLILTALGLLVLINLGQRLSGMDELYYAWIPWGGAALYALSAKAGQTKREGG